MYIFIYIFVINVYIIWYKRMTLDLIMCTGSHGCSAIDQFIQA